MRAKEISQKLSDRAPEIAKLLLPNGKTDGNNWRVGNVLGEAGQSLSVCVTGDNRGCWKDFATNEGGDLLDLWCATHHITLSQAIKAAKQWLGVSDVIAFEPSRTKIFSKPISKTSSTLSLEAKNYLINQRKLTAETLEKFKICSDKQEIIFPYYYGDELLLEKRLSLHRMNGKKNITTTSNAQPCLFGWQGINTHSRSIALCEGEFDAMSLYQYGISALSIPFGAGNHHWVEYEFEHLSHFDEIYLCFDNDEAGHKSIAALIERLGRHRCLVVTLPHKDANEALQQGMSKDEIQTCFEAAKRFEPTELKPASEFRDSIKDEFYPTPGTVLGYHPPFEKLIGKILFAPSELSIWTGINGHGKSQFLGQIILSCMKQGARVCIASLELKPKKLLMRMTRQAAALSLPTSDYIDAIIDWYHDKLWIFDVTGNTKIDCLLDVFLYARQRYNVDVFVIDSLMRCGISEDDYNAQKSFVDKLCDFVKQHDCHLHLVAHARKGMDESKPVGKLDVKGTGAMTDAADYCFSIWRNKHKEESTRKTPPNTTGNLQNAQPDCLWICDKNRNNDWEGTTALWFDVNSYQYLSNSTQQPQRYVEFSILS